MKLQAIAYVVGLRPRRMVALTEYLPLTRTWVRIDGMPFTLVFEANASDRSVIHTPAWAFFGPLPVTVTVVPALTAPGVTLTVLYGLAVAWAVATRAAAGVAGATYATLKLSPVLRWVNVARPAAGEVALHPGIALPAPARKLVKSADAVPQSMLRLETV